MLLTIHDSNLQKVAFIDNEKQSTLNYYDDAWTRNLETGSSTFEFTVFKKAIKSDTASHKIYSHLNEKAFVSFKYHSKSYVFSVMTVEENEQTIKCYCENLNLELINEYANPYKATKAMSFVEYCNAMDLLNFTFLKIGINEISDQKRTLQWEGQDTKLARLLSLATKFDAEIDFDTELNADSSIKAFKVNVYHENDDSHQGVGRVRNDIQLTYGKNLKSIRRKIDKTGIYNAIRPTGKGKTKNAKGEEVETVVTISGLGAWSENNADGVREFYQSGEMLYAPLSMQMYPSAFTSSTTNDQWIRKDIEVESDNPTVIRAAAIRDLKKNAYPALTYEVDGFIDVEIGDTIRIYDDGLNPVLLIEARVSDQKISFTNPTRNKTTFANFKALKNRLSANIQSALERLFESAKPYKIRFSTDNGVIFKNNSGQTIVTPSLSKAGKPVVNNVSWRWLFNDKVMTGATFSVKAADITDTAVLSVAAYIGNTEVAADEITFANVSDGERGEPGQTAHVHIAWADNETGTEGFSLTNSSGKSYMGIYTDFDAANSTDPTKYKWVKTKGSLDNEQLADINAKIDAKSDANLTQEQMNMLNERLQLMEVEAQAKASMENFSELEKQFLAFVAANAEGVAKSEEDLVAIAERVEKMVLEFGGMKEMKTFIDTYMSNSEEGMVIGKNDGSSVIKVSNDRISMFSAGKEVMYISQGVIHIDNGIFTASVQIGRFRTEEYHFNPDVNVVRYVGHLDVV